MPIVCWCIQLYEIMHVEVVTKGRNVKVLTQMNMPCSKHQSTLKVNTIKNQLAQSCTNHSNIT